MVAPIRSLPDVPNLTSGGQAVAALIIYSSQFFLSFGIGMVVSVTINLLGWRRGKAFQKDTWMRALVIGLIPAALLLFGAWKAARL
jgi:hypothetical protein